MKDFGSFFNIVMGVFGNLLDKDDLPNNYVVYLYDKYPEALG
jgi:hypothetical protein